MKTRILIHAAVGVIAAALFLLIHYGNRPEKARAESEPERLTIRSISAPKPPADHPETSSLQEAADQYEPPIQRTAKTATARDDSHAATAPSLSNHKTPLATSGQSTDRVAIEQSSPEPAPTRRAIQLAENFRLPASVLAPGMNRNTPNATVSPAISAATQEIADSFYRALAATPPDTEETPEDIALAVTESEETQVITPTAETEQIRVQADELYRTLFGDAAYGQQTMSSLIEVRLPPLPGAEPEE